MGTANLYKYFYIRDADVSLAEEKNKDSEREWRENTGFSNSMWPVFKGQVSSFLPGEGDPLLGVWKELLA